MNNIVIDIGGGQMTGIQPGFWPWVFFHPWMTFFICLALCEALIAWGKALGRKK